MANFGRRSGTDRRLRGWARDTRVARPTRPPRVRSSLLRLFPPGPSTRAADLRCFPFSAPALPLEPLIFVEVVLTRGLTSSVDPLIRIDREVLDHSNADTAIFYSISNCQPGL